MNFLKKNILCRYGVPHSIVTDNGVQFNNDEVINFCEEYGTKMLFPTLAHLQTNGQAKAVNKTIKNLLNKKLDDVKRLWAKKLVRNPHNSKWWITIHTRIRHGWCSPSGSPYPKPKGWRIRSCYEWRRHESWSWACWRMTRNRAHPLYSEQESNRSILQQMRARAPVELGGLGSQANHFAPKSSLSSMGRTISDYKSRQTGHFLHLGWRKKNSQTSLKHRTPTTLLPLVVETWF